MYLLPLLIFPRQEHFQEMKVFILEYVLKKKKNRNNKHFVCAVNIFKHSFPKIFPLGDQRFITFAGEHRNSKKS